ncbi:hypothetical protein ACFD7R_004527 [Vibrio parahaemolyticus]
MVIAVVLFVIFLAWFIHEPSFEPAAGMVSAVGYFFKDSILKEFLSRVKLPKKKNVIHISTDGTLNCSDNVIKEILLSKIEEEECRYVFVDQFVVDLEREAKKEKSNKNTEASLLLKEKAGRYKNRVHRVNLGIDHIVSLIKKQSLSYQHDPVANTVRCFVKELFHSGAYTGNNYNKLDVYKKIGNSTLNFGIRLTDSEMEQLRKKINIIDDAMLLFPFNFTVWDLPDSQLFEKFYPNLVLASLRSYSDESKDDEYWSASDWYFGLG